jgi:hypothetical protein
MATDLELERHRETWLGFARLMRWAVGLVVVVLVGMALFLL